MSVGASRWCWFACFSIGVFGEGLFLVNVGDNFKTESREDSLVFAGLLVWQRYSKLVLLQRSLYDECFVLI